MCALCDEVGTLPGGITLCDRPAQRFAGLIWDGPAAEAAAGAIHPLFGSIKAFSAARESGPWRSPIVGLSLEERADAIRYFVGISISGAEAAPAGMEVVDLPEMVFASIWHLPDDGDVAAHYARMAQVAGAAGLALDPSRLCRREEYPPGVDPAGPPSLRLMLPLALPDAIGAG